MVTQIRCDKWDGVCELNSRQAGHMRLVPSLQAFWRVLYIYASRRSWVQVPPEAAIFSLKITTLGELCCVAVGLLGCCVAMIKLLTSDSGVD